MKKIFFLAALCGLLSALPAQDFSSLYLDLDELDQLMSLQQQTLEQQKNLLANLEEQLQNSMSVAESSSRTISGLKSISEAQGEYVNRLQEQLRQAELIRQAQLRYQKGLGLELKLWKIGTITFGAASLGLLIWALSK